MNRLKTFLTWLRNSTSRTLPIVFLQIFCKILDSFQVIVKCFIHAEDDYRGTPDQHEWSGLRTCLT